MSSYPSAFLRVFASFLAAASLGFAASSIPPVKKILFFSRSAGFEHGVISYQNGRPSFVEKVLTKLAPEHGLNFTFSKDGSLFSPEYLPQFDAIMFYTTGDLTTEGGDGQPAMTAAGKAALLQAIEGGKGFIGVHSATDTWMSPGSETNGAAGRFRNDGPATNPYIRMLGGEFIQHDAQQEARLTVVDPKFPGIAAVPQGFRLHEEWYSLKNLATDMHALLVIQAPEMNGPAYQRPPYPVTWARRQGQGRVFYTALGHREDVWENPIFQSILLGGIDWALRRVDADVSPNIAQAAPQATTLPPVPPGVK
jgi:type 1 glutamine amidotransferase